MSPSERSDREAAGRWLREQRRRKGFETVGGFARAIGVDTSRVSNYETGKSEVPDDRAERIAEVLGLDIITVRKNLGLWVPPDGREDGPSTDDLLDEHERILDEISAALPDRNQQQVEAAKKIIRLAVETSTMSNGSS
jgi:transcriptional regulator with XRE-family HTH domain